MACGRSEEEQQSAWCQWVMQGSNVEWFHSVPPQDGRSVRTSWSFCQMWVIPFLIPGKLTCPIKKDAWKTMFLLKRSLYRGHVKGLWGVSWCFWSGSVHGESVPKKGCRLVLDDFKKKYNQPAGDASTEHLWLKWLFVIFLRTFVWGDFLLSTGPWQITTRPPYGEYVFCFFFQPPYIRQSKDHFEVNCKLKFTLHPKFHPIPSPKMKNKVDISKCKSINQI